MSPALTGDPTMTTAPARPKLTLQWRGKTEPVPDIVFVEEAPPPSAASTPPPERRLEITPFTPPGPLDICLGHWISWMHQDDRDLGVKGQVGIKAGPDDDEEHEGYDDGAAAEAAAARASREIALATNAMIESLDRHHKSAIYRRCNVASVWRFPTMDFSVELPLAEQQLIEKLKKNIATRAFW